MSDPHTTPACLITAREAHEGELRGWLRRATGDRQLAEDLLQDLFLKALRQGRGFCEVRHARAWLFRAARNLRIDHLRVQKDRLPLPDDLAEPEHEVAPVASLARCLPRALQALDDQDADALRRCDLEGMTQADYAELHGLSVPGAKSRVQRARRRLKARLTEQCRVRFDEIGRICCFTPRPGERGAG